MYEYSINENIKPYFDNQSKKYYYFDIINNKKITDPIFDDARYFSYGMAIVSQKKENKNLYGYINQDGKISIPIEYEAVGYFGDSNTAPVWIDNRWYLINRENKIISEAPNQKKRKNEKKELKIGDKVKCSYKNDEIEGIITKIREKTITIELKDGSEIWRYFSSIIS